MGLSRPVLILALLVLAPIAFAADIGYVESFSLAADRAKALEQLTPGTEDYYYYHGLQAQNSGDRAGYAKVMTQWAERLGESERSRLLKRRQVLLDYPVDPKATLEALRSELGLSFDHQRVDAAAEAQIPAAWNPQGGDPAERLRGVLAQQSGIEEITDEGLSLLAHQPLNREQLRQLLSRITRPDYPDLVSLVVRELSDRQSSGFGALAVHQLLTAEQLDACARERPVLMRDDRFVRELLVRMRPADHIDLKVDREERAKYLARLLAFSRQLEPVHNSLKALVLYHNLADARVAGTYPADLFREYLSVPRNVSYLARGMRERAGYNPLAEL